MNILSRLPLIGKTESDEIEEISEEQARLNRIAFHRERVRNGPVKFSPPTSGQIRREAQRALARKTKKAHRNQVQIHFATQAQASTLRGQLQAAGVLAYNTEGFVATPQQALSAIVWIVKHFADDSTATPEGQVVLDRGTVLQALTSCLNRYQSLNRSPITPLSPAYVLPVRLSV